MEEDPDLLSSLELYYNNIDNDFIDAISETDRVFIASKLIIDTERAADRLRIHTEQRLESIPAPPGIETLFKSSLPLWKPFTDSATPVIVNQYLDNDGKIRSCPLLIPYKGADRQPRYYLSAAFSLILNYLEASPEDIYIDKKYIRVRNARVPVVDEKTGRLRTFKEELSTIDKNITKYPENFNTDLFNYLINEYGYYYPDDLPPALPLPVRIQRTEAGAELIEGAEIIEAAKLLGIKKISYILYELQDFKISHRLHETGNPFTFLINFAGSEQIRYQDPYTDEIKVHSPVKTVSYADIASDNLPVLPDLLRTPIESVSLRNYKEWFISFCSEKADQHGAELIISDIIASPTRDSAFLLFHAVSGSIKGENSGMAADFTTASLEKQLEAVNDRISELGGDEQLFIKRGDIFYALQAVYAELIKALYGSHLFVGYQSRGISYDLLQTPYDNMFGTHVLINALGTIITGNQLHPIPAYQESLLIITLSLGFALLYSRFSSVKKSLIFAGQIILLYIAGYMLFARLNIVTHMGLLLFSQILLFTSSTLVKLLFEEKDKRFYQSTFSRYLSPEIIDSLYKSGEHPILGGESQNITAFFSDIEGFATISEKLSPEMLVDFLNTYLSAMTSIIIENQGTLDKYIGDAIVAFFGAPYHYEDTPLKAVSSALLIQQKLDDLKEIWKQLNEPWVDAVGDIHMRIGLNTGNIITGNIGSYMRMDYTMIGDDVNLASRLESAAKQYGIYTLMSERTYHQQFNCDDGVSRCVKDFINARFIDRIIVKGRSKPVDIYEPLSFKEEENPRLEELNNLFSRGTDKYLKKDWAGAIKDFEQSAKFENDLQSRMNPSLKYIDRCRSFQKEPPITPDGKWEGVFILKSK